MSLPQADSGAYPSLASGPRKSFHQRPHPSSAPARATVPPCPAGPSSPRSARWRRACASGCRSRRAGSRTQVGRLSRPCMVRWRIVRRGTGRGATSHSTPPASRRTASACSPTTSLAPSSRRWWPRSGSAGCSADHFTVDGTLLEAWASLKSYRPRDVPGNERGTRGGPTPLRPKPRSRGSSASNSATRSATGSRREILSLPV